MTTPNFSSEVNRRVPAPLTHPKIGLESIGEKFCRIAVDGDCRPSNGLKCLESTDFRDPTVAKGQQCPGQPGNTRFRLTRRCGPRRSHLATLVSRFFRFRRPAPPQSRSRRRFTILCNHRTQTPQCGCFLILSTVLWCFWVVPVLPRFWLFIWAN